MTVPIIVNFRDEETGLPSLDDEAFTAAIIGVMNEHGKQFKFKEENVVFSTEGEYGPSPGEGQHWDDFAEGAGLVLHRSSSLFTPAVRARLASWQKEYEAILEDYSGDRLQERERELRVREPLMPDRKSYELGYRPNFYWGPQELEAHYGVRIKGELRRRAALLMLGDGHSDPVMFQSSLSDDERLAVGRVHPSLMGGEYLPDLRTLEVEIARVTVASTMTDVISFRARKTKRGIAYKIVDEYPEDGEDKYPIKPKTSARPLTLKQMIQAVNWSRIIEEIRGLNYEEDPEPETYYNFCTVSSEVFPQLETWFDECNEEWLEHELELRGEDD